MLGIHDFWVFVAAGILLILTPGQDTIYIAGRSIAQGRMVGIASALGVGTGGQVHVIGTTLGLPAVLATSQVAFAVVKRMGAAYLSYLGARLLLFRAESNHEVISVDADTRRGAAHLRSILTNVVNPKVTLLLLAFLPQFVDSSSTDRALAFMVLGETFVLTGTLWCLVVAVFSARASESLHRSEVAGSIVRRLVGGLLMGMAFRLAVERVR